MAEDRDRRVGGWMDRQTDKRKHPLPKPPTPEGGYQSQQARSRANMRANARVNQVSLGDAVAMAAAAWSEGHCGAMASVEPSVPGSTGRGRCGPNTDGDRRRRRRGGYRKVASNPLGFPIPNLNPQSPIPDLLALVSNVPYPARLYPVTQSVSCQRSQGAGIDPRIPARPCPASAVFMNSGRTGDRCAPKSPDLPSDPGPDHRTKRGGAAGKLGTCLAGLGRRWSGVDKESTNDRHVVWTDAFEERGGKRHTNRQRLKEAWIGMEWHGGDRCLPRAVCVPYVRLAAFPDAGGRRYVGVNSFVPASFLLPRSSFLVPPSSFLLPHTAMVDPS
ncbi:hypothetical protein BGZ61DRAFT_475009 [Ilyonectria robusta]|uniref:uncharacterized protein n=1 Tax=Ilyonectria robusta TaxID=1079257 RepID=UPI001E8E2A1B|nr:uncharacterized protein BGZ61DRAFT_475009 [Ilyonectria robusta]KAH8729378.1 hypothetical protein BGZ61DRAFT_475009 [Ilyonectria robusta]